MSRPRDAEVLRRVGGLLRPYTGRLVLVCAAILVSALLGVVTPFLTQAVFDRALFPADGSGVDVRLLGWLVAAMVAVPLVSSAIGVGQTYLTTTVGSRAMADLRGRLFAHLERMELAFFTATRTGSIQSRLANDVGGVGSVLTSTASSILANLVTVLASLVAMILLSWQLTLVALALMPVFVLAQRRVGERRQRIARRTQESLAEMTAITEESLSVSGILLSKVFNRADAEIARYRTENERQAGLQVRQAMTGQWFFGIVSAFMAVTPALVYLVAGLLITGGSTLSAGTLVAFSTLQARLLWPTVSLMRVALDVQTSLALFRRIFEYLDLQPAIVDRPGAARLDPATTRGHVELEDVWFAYPPPPRLHEPPPEPRTHGARGTGLRHGLVAAGSTPAPRPDRVVPAAPPPAAHPDGQTSETSGESAPRPTETPAWVLRGVSLEVRPGELLALVGPSGAGKTTLTYLVSRLYEPLRGQVRLDGVDVADLALDSLAEVVGMVTQDTYLFNASIRDNLLYVRPLASQAQLEEACKKANIHEFIANLPEGYDTQVGNRGLKLSGGEKQRLSIARVLLKDPAVVVFDEATSSLDSIAESLIQEAVAPMLAERTSIVIAHRLSTVLAADEILVLEQGRIRQRGSHARLLAEGGLYARLYETQFGAAETAEETDR